MSNVKFQLSLNKHPKDCPDYSLVNALNVRVSDDFSCLQTEESIVKHPIINDYILDRNLDIIGVIPCNKELVLFAKKSSSELPTSSAYILRYNEKTAGRVLDLPKLIRNGDKNIYVGFLQLFLNKYNGNRLVVDCDFGRKTEEALKNFQVFKGLEVDGIAGVETWTKVYSIMAQG